MYYGAFLFYKKTFENLLFSFKNIIKKVNNLVIIANTKLKTRRRSSPFVIRSVRIIPWLLIDKNNLEYSDHYFTKTRLKGKDYDASVSV